ncbi:MAG: chemotaxis response regulator protein-glutamate methylesterase [Chrysiogenetes bacterium]|nr:chemotaxis response regulator protein-glutamate methylesterase [Chrysiogenetes bacterium]
MGKGKIRVLVVDDSNFMRKAISNLLSQDPEIEVVGKARSGQEALELIPELDPTVVTLDEEMAGLTGLETLERIMAEYPRPVLMLSAYTKEGAEVTIEALRRGAIDFMEKPSGVVSLDMHTVAKHLIDKVKLAQRSRPRRPLRREPPRRKHPGIPRDEPESAATTQPSDTGRNKPEEIRKLVTPAESLLVVAASTGGVQAVQVVLTGLPHDWPMPTLIVQHMPPHFTESLAADLDRVLPLRVVEAEDGMLLEPRTVYIAPGGMHAIVAPARYRKGKKVVRLSQTPTDTVLKPAADVTMRAVADVYGGDAIGVVLTGMGMDGAQGLKAMHEQGAVTIAQDRETSVIYGMPKAAFEIGAADSVLPLDQVAAACRVSAGMG